MRYSKYAVEVKDSDGNIYGLQDSDLMDGISVAPIAGVAKGIPSDQNTTDSDPVVYRETPDADYCEDKLVGGTVVWNQLVHNGDFANNGNWIINEATASFSNNIMSLTASAYRGNASNVISLVEGHKYFYSCQIKLTTGTTSVRVGVLLNNGASWSAYKTTANTTDLQTLQGVTGSVELTSGANLIMIRDERNSGWDTIQAKNVVVFDLTQMFGSTIADYVYSLESATAGSGIAWLKQYGFFTKDYYAYDAGSLQSVQAASKKVYDSTETLIHTYPFDPDLTLRGIPKLDSNNRLYYDGDVYESDGTVTRKYGIVDMGTLTWNYSTSGNNSIFVSNTDLINKSAQSPVVCEKYVFDVGSHGNAELYTIPDKTCAVHNSAGGVIVVKDSSYTDAATFKTAMNGVYLVYELATPTTETADPFAVLQTVDPDGTEEYVDAGVTASTPTRDVAIPVGGDRKYYKDFRREIREIIAGLS